MNQTFRPVSVPPKAEDAAAEPPSAALAAARRWIGVLLVLAVVAVFGQVCRFDFVEWDDPYNAFRNPYLHPPDLSHLAHLWRFAYFELYMPVTYTLWWLAAHVVPVRGPEPGAPNLSAGLFHGLNLILHAANTLLVWRLLHLLLVRAGRDADSPGAEWSAALGALLFAVHPLQVESVAWVTGMNNLLSGLFVLLALLVYLRARMPDVPPARQRRQYLFATALYVLALLSKPMAASTPLLALALDWGTSSAAAAAALTRRRPADASATTTGKPAAAAAMLTIPILWAVLAAVAVVIARMSTDPPTGIYLPVWSRPIIFGYALSFYLVKLLAPLRLCVDYGAPPAVVLNSWWGYGGAVAIAMLAVILFWSRRRILQTGALAAVAALLPTLGLVPFYLHRWSTVGDRYAYLALIGPALCVAYYGQRLFVPPFPRRRNAILTLYGLLALTWAVLSAIQAATWANTQTLFMHTLTVNPRSVLSMYKLGTALEDEGDPDAALDVYREAVRITPDSAPAWYNLGSLLARCGRLDEGADCLQRALAIYPGYSDARNNLGLIREMQGQWRDAADQFRAALLTRPRFGAALDNLHAAEAEAARGSTKPGIAPPESDPAAAAADAEGIAEARQAHLDAAENAFRRAIRARPDYAAAFFNLGVTQDRAGERAEAKRSYRAALRRQPTYPEAHFNLGMDLAKDGKTDDAAAEWREAQRERPTWDLPARALQTIGATTAAAP